MSTLRIAVAGTHRSGKTSLVEAFGRAHPEYRVVPEPYDGLQEDLGEDPLDDLTPEAFQRQLEYMVELLIGHPTTESAIFDRCPLDFLAYSRAIDERDLGDSDWSVQGAVLQAIEAGLRALDMIVFVRPDGDRHPKPGTVRSLQALVDVYLSELIIDDVLGLLRTADAPAVHELGGSTARRVVTLSRLASAGEMGGLGRRRDDGGR